MRTTPAHVPLLTPIVFLNQRFEASLAKVVGGCGEPVIPFKLKKTKPVDDWKTDSYSKWKDVSPAHLDPEYDVRAGVASRSP